MPRFALTAQEQSLLGVVLALEADARGLSLPDALVAAANTTTAELRALVLTRLQTMRAGLSDSLANADAVHAAGKAQLTSQIAAIDSALAKI